MTFFYNKLALDVITHKKYSCSIIHTFIKYFNQTISDIIAWLFDALISCIKVHVYTRFKYEKSFSKLLRATVAEAVSVQNRDCQPCFLLSIKISKIKKNTYKKLQVCKGLCYNQHETKIKNLRSHVFYPSFFSRQPAIL